MVQHYVPPTSQRVVNPPQPTPSHIPNNSNLQTPPSKPFGGSNIQHSTPLLDPNFDFIDLDDVRTWFAIIPHLSKWLRDYNNG